MAMPKGELEAKLKEEHELISKGILREENPLDLSDEFNRFLLACRRGDIKECQAYIMAGGNINGKDEFDYTPLIIASLCGHYEVVQMLLEAGAMAERNTFQGERCLHNALNDRIRNLLLQYDYSKSSDPLQPWAAHVTSLLDAPEPKTSDVAVAAGGGGSDGKVFALHKFWLAARTPYFASRLGETGQQRFESKVLTQSPPESVDVVLRFVYLDDIATTTDPDDDVLLRGIDRVSRQLGVERLWEAMLAGTDDRRLARQRYEDELRRAQGQVVTFFEEKVLGHKMRVDVERVKDVRWPNENYMFADCLLMAEEEDERREGDDDERSEENEGGRGEGEGEGEGDEGERRDERSEERREDERSEERREDERSEEKKKEKKKESERSEEQKNESERSEEKKKEEKKDWLPGLTQGNGQDHHHHHHHPPHRRHAVLYPAHKAMLIRSDYFRTMFASAFLEAQPSPHLRVIPVDCRPPVLEAILSFLYTEQADAALLASPDVALDVLYAADMMLLDKLKGRAAVALSASIGPENIYDVLHAAWDLKVQRLEEFAARAFAARLEHYLDAPAFAAVVQESAARLTTREATDSIELVDDIRYYLSERFRMRFEDLALDEAENAAGGGRGEAGAAAVQPVQPVPVQPTPSQPALIQPTPETVLRDLNGNIVEDEFDIDAFNYQILLDKLDRLLESLGLDG